MARKQDWSTRVPAMHIEIQIDLHGELGQDQFNTREIQNALIEYLNWKDFDRALINILKGLGQPAKISDVSVSANRIPR